MTIIRNTGSGVSVELADGQRVEVGSIAEAFTVADAHKRPAGPPIRCPDCRYPEDCACLPTP